MPSILRDLAIGTIGSVIGALLVYLFTRGARLTREAQYREKAKREKEEDRWRNGSPGERWEITNEYLFGILKYMLLGNLLWALPSLFVPLFHFAPGISMYVFEWATVSGAAAGSIYFYRGLALVLRYSQLRRP